jgi:hypothetical protein
MDHKSKECPCWAVTPRKEQAMAINAGIWVDHRKAIIVRITDHEEETRQIEPDVDNLGLLANRPHSTNPYTPNDFVAEDKLQRKLASELNQYYDEIIACIRDADAVLILGPGEAKLELKKRMEGKKLGDRIIDLQPADKRSDRQIAAMVRQYFAPQVST